MDGSLASECQRLFFGRVGLTGRREVRDLEEGSRASGSTVSVERRQARRGEHKMAGGDSSTGSGGGFRSRLEHFLYSGDKKHVFAGIAIISVVFGAPWFFMNRASLMIAYDARASSSVGSPLPCALGSFGSKHQSHQDYMEKADKARSQRLSSGQPSVK
ncbi:hypothetical protein IEQ34_022712 [Dendrobium chrysotoxum]|uniref:Uncharacterized protein n=1 Tax=Dendrobium chrysotoxum TaxID=161865 RepID=A0AAV7FZT4_DENCH|nr:hypothetical protein IEQ34_022712 [Dendrobium chrysotoxum]